MAHAWSGAVDQVPLQEGQLGFGSLFMAAREGLVVSTGQPDELSTGGCPGRAAGKRGAVILAGEDQTIATTVAITLLALVGGFFAGIVLSELIGIIGWLAFHSLVGFKLVPVVAALAAAGAAVVVNLRARRRADQTATHSTVHHRP